MNVQTQPGRRSANVEQRSERRFLSAVCPPRRGLLPLLACAVVAAFPAAGDPLSELRTALQRYPGKAPFSVAGSVQVNDSSQDVAGAASGSTTFEVELGPSGLTIRVSPSALGLAGSEAANKKHDPERPTPTRMAMVALTTFDVIDAVDAAGMLLNDLTCATLITQIASTHAGKPATLWRVKVKATLTATSSRFVNEPHVELQVWTDANGVPIAAERDSTYSASFLFVKAGNVRKERWEFAVTGDRLYATRNDQENRATALGKSVVSSHTVSYLAK